MRVTRRVTARERKGERRRIKIIKPHFQIKFILHFVGLNIVGLLLANLFVFGYYFWRSGFDLATQLMYRATPTAPIQKVSMLQLLGPAMLASLAIAVAISFFIGREYSHRIAGPLYRFERTFQEVRGGRRIDSVTLRKHDEFKEVAAEFNRLLRWLWRGRRK